jgi:putative transposase
MPWAKAPPAHVSRRQRQVLERLIRASTTPQAVGLRARIVCAAADGWSTRRLAQSLRLSRNTIRLWRERWGAAGTALQAAEAAVEGGPGAERALEGVVRGVLADAPRPGAPPTFTPEQWCQLMAVACEPPGDSDRPISQWTPRELADEAVKRGLVERISARTVGRFLVLGSGRAQAAPQPILAHATRRRSRGVRRAGAGGL